MDKNRGRFILLLRKLHTPTPHAYKHEPYTIKLHHILILEKRSGSQMSCLHKMKTTYKITYKSDVSWFRRIKDVVKYCVFVSVNATVSLTQATVYYRALYNWRHLNVLKWCRIFNLLQPTGHVMHQQFNIQQLYALPTLYLCVLYLSENKQRLVPLTA